MHFGSQNPSERPCSTINSCLSTLTASISSSIVPTSATMTRALEKIRRRPQWRCLSITLCSVSHKYTVIQKVEVCVIIRYYQTHVAHLYAVAELHRLSSSRPDTPESFRCEHLPGRYISGADVQRLLEGLRRASLSHLLRVACLCDACIMLHRALRVVSPRQTANSVNVTTCIIAPWIVALGAMLRHY